MRAVIKTKDGYKYVVIQGVPANYEKEVIVDCDENILRIRELDLDYKGKTQRLSKVGKDKMSITGDFEMQDGVYPMELIDREIFIGDL